MNLSMALSISPNLSAFSIMLTRCRRTHAYDCEPPAWRREVAGNYVPTFTYCLLAVTQSIRETRISWGEIPEQHGGVELFNRQLGLAGLISGEPNHLAQGLA
jgi:hypothetical protein